ncbi:hypothetical protein MED297_17413 [Reinekea sp. MED297]|uniref:Uncharacterized protein n=2 Tax=Reinekea TaxID=230494 RepID=A4BFP8_9GAMM|nr:hypothetical protein MED297_17413 [Reinekea sp. MED297] [Reinekea blandensis MED297]
MKNIILILLVAFYTLASTANADTLEDFIAYFEKYSAEETQVYVENYISKSEGKYFADIENRVSQQGTGEELPTRWRYSAFKDGSGFKIFLPIDSHYPDPKPDISKYEVLECSNNGASSGTVYVDFGESKTFSHSWSCGSIGCSFDYIFTENADACN